MPMRWRTKPWMKRPARPRHRAVRRHSEAPQSSRLLLQERSLVVFARAFATARSIRWTRSTCPTAPKSSCSFILFAKLYVPRRFWSDSLPRLLAEGVAALYRSLIQSFAEPVHPLLRRSMRKCFWADSTARHLLQPVITHG